MLMQRVLAGNSRAYDQRYGPSLVLDVARGGLADMVRGATVSFSRASAAWAFDSSGVLRQYASGVPRLVPAPSGAPSALLELQRTNTLLHSRNLANVAWGGAATCALNQTGVDAVATSASSVARTATNPTYRQQAIAKLAAAELWTVSGYAKKLIDDHFAVRLQGTYPARVDVCFNLATGVISSAATAVSGFSGASASISLAPGAAGAAGWYRWALTATTDAAAGLAVLLSPRNTAGVVDAAASSTTSAVAVDCVNLEQGAYDTSPIITTTTAVTRAGDILSAAPTINSVEGTLYVDAEVPTVAQNAHLLAQLYQTDNDYMALRQNTIATVFTMRKNAIASGDIGTAGTITANARVRMAGRYKAGDNGTCRNGGAVNTNTRNDLTITPTAIFFGSFASMSSGVTYLREARYFTTPLTDAQLQELTA